MRPFVLLQLSDLHFGPNSRFAGMDMEGLAERCADAVRDARQQLRWQEDVGLVLVTGDIAEAARPGEYESALIFFGALVGKLGMVRSAVVFVPGNHDVSWTQCQAVEGQLRDELFPATERRGRLDAVKLTRFNDMVARFYDPSLPRHPDTEPGPARPATAGLVTSLSSGAYVHDFEDLAVSVAALDSCEVESHRDTDHRGYIGNDQAQAVLAHWRDGAPADRIRIVAVHHNPVPTIPPAIREWRDWLRSKIKRDKLNAGLFEHFAADAVGFEGHERLQAIASDAQVSLLFHGHHHASDAVHAWAWRGKRASGDTRVISAGSWSLVAKKLPADQPVVMQLVRVDPGAAAVQPILLRYEPRARTEGVVEPGAFVLDEVTREHAPLTLSLPTALRAPRTRKRSARPPAGAMRPPRASAKPATAALVAAYRNRKQDTFVRWDLRAVGASPRVGNHRPVEVNLDDMYVPLRFDEKYDLTRLDRGAPIESDRLLQRTAPLVIIGNAGSGKTTWMKRTFRQLLRSPTAVPFFLELRAIAASWDKRTDAEQTIEAFLADEVRPCGIPGWEGALAWILDGSDGLQPVLLVDGWDELGDLGERVRTRLSEFRAAHKRAVIVVSSRPYGEARPAGSEGFETLEIQPLDDPDLRLLTHNFHRRVHGEDSTAADRSTSDFMARLTAVPEAQALGRTALLLTMMLLLSREGPLPDKRHKLYLACVRNLLDARPALRESEGAQLLRNEWRPHDPEERLRAVSGMAYRMQSDGYITRSRGPIVRRWHDAAQLLPESWKQEHRDGFLLWLINSAGVLVDRSDLTISFAHLSFQEFLAAHFLFATQEGDARIEAVHTHAMDPDWWETLRLWAGLTGDQSPDKLAPVLISLRQEPGSFWLAGAILADGTGQAADFEAWRQDMCGWFMRCEWTAARQCARAWAASKQHERRTELTARVAALMASDHWLDGADLAHWSEAASIAVARSPELIEVLDPVASDRALARSRALAGSSWRWPRHDLVMALRLWPSRRSRIGLTLQTLASLRSDRARVLRVASSLIEHARRSMFDPEIDAESVRDFIWNLELDFGQDIGWGFRRGFEQDFARDFGRDLLRDFGPAFQRHWGRIVQTDAMLGFVRDFVRDFREYFHLDIGWARWQEFWRDLGLYGWQALPQWSAPARSMEADVTALDFALLETASAVGRASVRAAIANLPVPDTIELGLLQFACRVSLGHESVSLGHESVEHQRRNALWRYKGDPLWSALARHVARISTPEDRALLEDLAAHPEQRDAPVSWALRYYVRGDIAMCDGTVVTMNEICDELGEPRLPLLEDMPPEIDIDFRADDIENEDPEPALPD